MGQTVLMRQNTDYVNIIAKSLEMQGNLVGNRVDVILGENFVDNNGAVTSKVE